ncbi:MAG: Secreted beta-lactamase family protein [Anaerocolumna sp.]|jgi:CubicO group peptidase (beta-lactamase class C family)|nr:Secreted beta-lactamase family protein [Anaerocolumna sp.]
MISEKILDSIKTMCAGHVNIKFTVAVMQNGKTEKYLYGKDGVELPYEEYHYEIGSITKTFVAAILAKAVNESVVSLDDRINKFIPELPNGSIYPTLKRLATHTAGYPADTKEFDEEFIKSETGNLYNQYTYAIMLNIIHGLVIEDKEYEAKYSNFGLGVLAVALSKAYGKSIPDLFYDLLLELDLRETFIGYKASKNMDIQGYDLKDESTGNLLWDRECIVGPAGFLFSTAGDLLKYANSQIEDSTGYLHMCHTMIAPYQRGAGLPMDIGLCWMLVPDINLMFHNGGTKSFHTILCIDKESKTVVIMLCNYMLDDVSNTAINYFCELTGKK